MRAIAAAAALVALAGAIQATSSPSPSRSGIRPVPMTRVELTDSFWRPRMDINRRVTIPHILRQNEETGRVGNFLKAARKLEGPYTGQRYNDTDVYKTIEAASYSLALFPDPQLDATLDSLVGAIAAAQEPDGYIFPARTVDPRNPPPGTGPERWSYLHTSHELYNAGHLYEAAIAHFEATGKRTLLDVAIKNADLVCRVFGPDRRRDVPGHEEIELALVKLHRVTGDRKYLDQAKFFLDQRGRPHSTPAHRFDEKDRFSIYNDPVYRQDHQPLTDQARAIGHAVRATYLYSAMSDVAALLRDGPYARAVERLWQDVVSKRIYLTGGLGSQGRTEAFGDDYQLPNQRAYAETCASIGGMLWYHRMFLRTGDGKYLDTFERTLYNGYLSGVSTGGAEFFYQNPLESDGKRQRSAYFDVACCPANLARLMAQLPGLIYAASDAALYVNLFVGSTARAEIGQRPVAVTQTTRYPWDGLVRIAIDPDRPAEFTVNVRLPGWADNRPIPSDLYRYAGSPPDAGPILLVNGEPMSLSPEAGFASIRRRWRRGDVVELALPMRVRRVLAQETVEDNRGKAAIERGPLVYAIEGVDNGGRVADIILPLDARLDHEYRKDLLNGVEVITARIARGDTSRRTVVAIPYFAWANRGKSDMAVWVPYR